MARRTSEVELYPSGVAKKLHVAVPTGLPLTAI
jgi:hypothetical protein